MLKPLKFFRAAGAAQTQFMKHNRLRIALNTTLTLIGLILIVANLPRLLPPSITMQYNDWRLSRFGQQLIDWPRPAETTLVNYEQSIRPFGKDDHCGFFADITLETDSHYDDVKQFYQQLAQSRPHQPPPLIWLRSAASLQTPTYLGAPTDAPFTYRITLRQLALSPNIDPRCAPRNHPI